MKFLLEILGMTNYCNLNCSYCDWEKHPYTSIENQEIINMKSNLKKLADYVNIEYPEIQLVEYSGGEPFLYPEIIMELLDVFNDKWIRIITNGTLINDEHIRRFKKRGKIFIAVSLDGHTLDMNTTRFYNNEDNFKKTLETIDKLIQNKIPTMILCTISQINIDKFPNYISFLEEKYEKAINDGLLVLPAHSVCDYGKDRKRAISNSCNKFTDFVKNSPEHHPLIYKIQKHYENLAFFLSNKERFRHCSLYDWSISVHFRGKEIIENGNFFSFGCGMRGLVDLGLKNINSSNDLKLYKQQLDKENLQSIFENPLKSPYQCRNECFVDWEAFDLIINNDISIEEAEKWFVLFKDTNIKKFIKNYNLKLNL